MHKELNIIHLDKVDSTNKYALRNFAELPDAPDDEDGRLAASAASVFHAGVVAELIDDGGKLLPIEVNPLRFGAWCTSADLTHHAFRFNPYTYYINKLKPDWDEILKASGDHVYSIVILENSTGIKAKDIVAFDYDKAVRALGNTEVLELRKINFSEYPIFGILFTRTAPGDQANIERILQADMKDFLVSK